MDPIDYARNYSGYLDDPNEFPEGIKDYFSKFSSYIEIRWRWKNSMTGDCYDYQIDERLLKIAKALGNDNLKNEIDRFERLFDYSNKETFKLEYQIVTKLYSNRKKNVMEELVEKKEIFLELPKCTEQNSVELLHNILLNWLEKTTKHDISSGIGTHKKFAISLTCLTEVSVSFVKPKVFELINMIRYNMLSHYIGPNLETHL